jgi:cytochrome c553
VVLKITARRLAVAVASLLVAGIAFAWSGVFNVAASSGHWAISDWFLHWAMRNSVRTHAAFSVEAAATEPSRVVSAAGHYAANCASCHGAPGVPLPPVMQAATPAPPELRGTVDAWTDRQLFWIIKHGVKFTAMPAWPAPDRDDEVWRMVAFVRQLPSMNPAEYEQLAQGPTGRVAGSAPGNLQEALPDCERCHAGNGRDQPDIPVLAGQKPAYLAATLQAYAAGKRSSAVMTAAASRLDGDVIGQLADHYARLPDGLSESAAAVPAERVGQTPVDPVKSVDAVNPVDHVNPANPVDPAEAARRIVANGLPDADLPACGKCHSAGKRADYPILAGQKPEYLAARLRLWRGDPNVVEARKPNESMPTIARRIPEDMIEPLARHFGK